MSFTVNSGCEDSMVLNSPNDVYITYMDLDTFLIPSLALDFTAEIDNFIGHNHDPQALELDPDDWAAISQVSGWLKAFQSAMTEMSKMKKLMLSTVHAIFKGLQDHMSSILQELPNSVIIKTPHRNTPRTSIM
jgi:hypothetical protein